MTYSTLQIIIDSPKPNQLYLRNHPVFLKVHLLETDSTQPVVLPEQYQLCFLHGNFDSKPDPNNKHHCFANNLLTGVIDDFPIGFHRISIFIKDISADSINDLHTLDSYFYTDTYFQVLGFAPLDGSTNTKGVTAHLWHCPDDTMCKQQLVDIINEPRETYTIQQTSPTKGYGIVVQSLIPQKVANNLLLLADNLSMNMALDTVDKKPSVQVDLWHRSAGVPAPDLNSIKFTAEVYRSVFPSVLQYINELYPWMKENVTCTDAFVRRYRPGERLGVRAHEDTSDLTVNCLLSSSDTGFSGGFVYRFINEFNIDIVPTNQGDCVLHAGQIKHGATPTTMGTRYTLIMFWKLKEKLKGSSTYDKNQNNPALQERIKVDGKTFVREL